jgi:hypothetical protein
MQQRIFSRWISSIFWRTFTKSYACGLIPLLFAAYLDSHASKQVNHQLIFGIAAFLASGITVLVLSFTIRRFEPIFLFKVFLVALGGLVD